MLNFYSLTLKNSKEKNLYRQLVESDAVDAATIKRGKKNLISFACNDYFGLSQNLAVKKSAIAAIKKYGVGARASRYVTGNNSLYTKLEKQIARMKKCDEAIVFSSGYACAIGVIPALVGEGDLIVADKLIHSSLIDGSKLSGAKLMRFLHNDVLHARKILQENRGKFKKCLIVTETVFSMDGDVGEVDELLKLAVEFEAILVSDDAHGLWGSDEISRWTGFVIPSMCSGQVNSGNEQKVGVTNPDLLQQCDPRKFRDGDLSWTGFANPSTCSGQVNSGNEQKVGVTNPVQPQHKIIQDLNKTSSDFVSQKFSVSNADAFDPPPFSKEAFHLQLGTLSKSTGSLGGYASGNKILIDYLRNFAKSAIYSTALPPGILAASLTSLKIIERKNLGKKTLENAAYFCQLMNLPNPQSAIVPIIIGDNKKTLEIARKVAKKGFLISAIRPPTVEVGKARLRITFSSEHKKTQIKKLAEVLINLFK